MASGTVTVTIVSHGFYTSTVEGVRKAEAMGRDEILRRISTAYDGTEYAIDHWTAYPTAVLAVILADLWDLKGDGE